MLNHPTLPDSLDTVKARMANCEIKRENNPRNIHFYWYMVGQNFQNPFTNLLAGQPLSPASRWEQFNRYRWYRSTSTARKIVLVFRCALMVNGDFISSFHGETVGILQIPHFLKGFSLFEGCMPYYCWSTSLLIFDLNHPFFLINFWPESSLFPGACEKSAKWQEAIHLLGEVELQRLEGDPARASQIVFFAMSNQNMWTSTIGWLTGYCHSCYTSTKTLLLTNTKGTINCSATSFFRHLRKRGNFPPGDLILHNAAIRACEQATKWQQALHLLHQAEENQLRTNEITYSSAPWMPWTPWTGQVRWFAPSGMLPCW